MVLAVVPVAKTGILKMDLLHQSRLQVYTLLSPSRQGCHARLRFSIEKGYRNLYGHQNWYVACHSCKDVIVCPKKNGNCAF